MKKLCILGLILALLFIAIPVVADNSIATGNPIHLAGFGTLSAFNQTVADFSVNVTSGIAPLTVGFTDLSVNATGWVWYFGDESYNNAWQQMNASDGFAGAFHNSAVALPDGSIVYCPASYLRNETYRSTDNGTSWQLVNESGGWAARIGSFNSMVVLSDGTIVKMSGGDGGTTYYNDTWASTDKGSTWQLVNASSGWSARMLTAVVALPDDSIVLMGGGNGIVEHDVWRSTDKGSTWTQVNTSPGWSGRRVHAAVPLPDGSIVLTGGYDGSNNLNDTWRSTDNGYTWTQVNASSGWSARRALSAAAMPDGSIALFGGITDSETYLNDTWRSTDNGYTWTQVNSSNAFSPRAASSVVVTSDGSLVMIDGLSSTFPNDVWRLRAEGSTEQNPSHTYTTPGTYQVTLQVFNADGYNSTRKTGYITVSPPTAPVANFTALPVNGNAPLNVTFTDLSTNLPTAWNWTFGDGSIENATAQHPVHTYLTPGVYDVSLNASNSAGFDTFTRVAYINVTSMSASKIGIYQDGTWYLDMDGNGVWDGPVTDRQVTAFGMPGWTQVVGDWNGDNRTEIGIYQDGTWYLDMDGNGVWDGPVTDRQVMAFGMPGWTQVVGDWNGDGRTEIGIYQDGTWYLDMDGNGVWDGPVTDRQVTAFGMPGWTQVVGDWNGDNRTEIGIYQDGTWYLDMDGNGVWDGPVTDRQVMAFGMPGWTQVVGDWNGDNRTEIGIYQDGTWYLDMDGNGVWDGPVTDRLVTAFGMPGWTQVVGDWNGDNRTEIGIYQDGTWYLDMDGNGVWDGPVTDRQVTAFGMPGWTQVTGKW